MILIPGYIRLEGQLNTEYNVRNIHFVDGNVDAKKIIESLNVSRYVKSDNFHEVTIEIIDFEPDVENLQISLNNFQRK